MTSSYKHRFARTFHQISRDNPDLPLGARFSMANLQLREQRLTALIAELEACRHAAGGPLTTGPAQVAPPSTTTTLAAADAIEFGPTPPVSGLIPAQDSWLAVSTGGLLPQARLGG